MSRSRRSRTLTALLGLWFLVAGQELPFPHPCEMGMAAVPVATAPGSPAVAVSLDEHAGHTEHDAHTAGSGESSNEEPSHGTCECIGDCCCAPAVDRVETTARLESRETATFFVRAPGTVRAPCTATPYLLPWANGPPSSLI
jgi:hypothetical protein